MRSKPLVAALFILVLVLSGTPALAAEPALITRPATELFGRQPGAVFTGSNVHTATGNYTQYAVDLDGSLSWGRTYNSLDSTATTLGRGWTPAFSARIAALDDGSARYHGDDGRVLTFAADGSGGYQRPQDLDADLAPLTAGGWSLRFRTGESWLFDADGRLSELTREGHRVVLNHDTDGRLTAVTHTAGWSLALSYDGDGRLVTVRAGDGREISYGYADSGLLASATAADGAVTRYEYDSDGRLNRVVGPSGAQLGANSYDGQGRVQRQVLTGGGSVELAYDDATGTTTVTKSPAAATWTYRHDAAGRVVEVVDSDGNSSTRSYTPDGRLSSGSTGGGLALSLTYDTAGNVTRYLSGGLATTYAYDALNRLTAVTAPTGAVTRYAYTGDSRIPAEITDPTGAVTRRVVVDGLVTESVDPTGAKTAYGYDSRRLLTSMTDPRGSVTKFEYDAAGRRSASISPSGLTTRYSRDAAGRVMAQTAPSGAQTRYQYTASGELKEKTDQTGAVTRFEYDDAGNRTSSTNEVGRTTTYDYDDDRQMTSATDPAGDVSRYSYDPMGRMKTITYRDGTVTRLSYDAEGRVTERVEPLGTTATSYDARGNVLTTTDGDGNVTRYEYDEGDRVIKVTDPTGAVWQTVYDEAGRVIATIDPTDATNRYEYDAAGRLTIFTDPLGHKTQYRYDAAGNNTEIIDPLGGITRHEYDADGRHITETTPAGLVTRYEYDADGRTTKVTDAGGGVHRFEYSARGEQIADIGPTGAIQRYRYDAAGQLVGAVDPNGNEATYTYDATGRLTSITDGKGAVTRYAYDVAGGQQSFTDPLDRTTRRTFDAAGRVTAITDPAGKTLRQEYNRAGDLVKRIGTDGSTITYEYDAARRRTAMTDAAGTTRYTYDAAGRLLTATTPDGRTLAHRYDAASRLVELTYPDGLKIAYDYDANDRLTSVHDPLSGDARYTFDADGRVVTESLPSDWQRRYHYTAGLLTRFEDVRNGQHAKDTIFGRDVAGRITTQTDGNKELRYTYDPADQLLAVHDNGGPILEATYDGAGNRTSITRDGELTRLSYDAADQLIGSDIGDEHTSYAYDPSGRLVEQADAAGRRTVAYNGFGLPATMTFAQGNITETRQFAYDAADRLVSLTSTTEGSSGTPRTRTMRYRWSEIDGIPQILEQREVPQGGRNATCPNNDGDPDVDGEYRADANFVYGQDRIFADSPCGSATFARDAFGSTVQTGATWRWAQSQEYDVFGAPKPNDAEGAGAGQPPQDPRFGYRGELAMGTLLHLRARTYDTVVGRFTARDPLATRAGQTDVVSPYAYGNNSPTNFTDPLGEFPIPDALLDAIHGVLPTLAAGEPCPEVENTPDGKLKCFQGETQGIIQHTRGGFDGPMAWALNAAQGPLQELWYSHQPEKAAQAFTINTLSESRDNAWGRFWDIFDYGLNVHVDWEVGPPGGGYQLRSDGVWTWSTYKYRIDIVTDERSIFELKRWNNGKGKDELIPQIARDLDKGLNEWTIRWEPSTELRDWADGFEVEHYEPWGWFRIPVKKEETDVVVWGSTDAGHLYFDEGELADPDARAKWKKRGGVRSKTPPRMPPPRRR